MSIVKRIVVLAAAVCMLVGSPAMKVSAACDHVNTGRDIQWTGQYRYSSYEHTVIVAYYANGTPITVKCYVNKTEKIYVTSCHACQAYTGVAYEAYQESHGVIHN